MNAYGRTPENTNAKVAIGVVAGVVIAVVGINLLPASGGEGRVSAEVSPSLSPSSTPDTRPPSPVVVAPPDEGYVTDGRKFRSIDGIPFSLGAPSGWESFGSDHPNYITKSITGSQGAEAKIFWTAFPDSFEAGMCYYLASRSIGPSAADLAAAVADVPGTDIVTEPSDVTVGGLPAKHVVFTVRDDVGCDPGFFFTYADTYGGALWPETMPGDTIRVWIVATGRTLFFIEGATHPGAGPRLEQELKQIVDSIQFGSSPLTIEEYIAQVDAVCSAATARAESGPPGDDVAWIENAVRVSDDALAELRALPGPDAVRAQMEEVFALLEAPIDVMRQVPAAASAGDTERVDKLQWERVDLTHRKDAGVWEVGSALGGALQRCPISLPA